MGNNYQLYRTNIKLGGQMKWDISIDSANGDLFVGGFNITPLSPLAPFNRANNKYLLSSSHLMNLKKFYSETESTFFKACEDPLISSLDPIIVPDDYNDHQSLYIDRRSYSSLMGLRRSQYKYSGKQYEFFCPLWLEDFDPDADKLKFKFTIKSKQGSITDEYRDLISKTLILSNNRSGNDFHNAFVNYLNTYIKDIHLNNDILKVDIKNNEAFLSGVNVKTGTYAGSKDISSLVGSIGGVERLLMDFDSLIINNFPNNHCVARQLFNFNFIFNADEFITLSTLNMMIGSTFCMDVSVSVIRNGKEKQLSIKDFYSNYDFIQSQPNGLELLNASQSNTRVNVFDIIKDYKDPELTDKNKTSQDIIHWVIRGDNDYIFNMYSGFCGHRYLKDSTRVTKQVVARLLDTDPDNNKSESASTMQGNNFLSSHNNTIVGFVNDVTEVNGMSTPIDWISISKSINSIKTDASASVAQYKSGATTVCNILRYIDTSSISSNELNTLKSLNSNTSVVIKVDDRYVTIIWEEMCGNIIRTPHIYQDAPDILASSYMDSPSSINWTSVIYCDTLDDVYNLSNNMLTNPDNVDTTVLGGEWSNHIKYGKILDEKYPTCMVVVPAELVSNTTTIFNSISDNENDNPFNTINEAFGGSVLSTLYCKMISGIYVFIVSEDNIDDVTYLRFSHNLRSFVTKNKGFTWLNNLSEWFDSVISPTIYSMQVLGYTSAKGPGRTAELSHVRMNKTDKIIRYDGYISPCFTSIDNNNFYVKNLIERSKLSSSPYIKHMKSGYPMKYPSINYYPYTAIDYTAVSERNISVPQSLQMPYEYVWFCNSVALLLKENIQISINSRDKNDPVSLEHYIKENLKVLYNASPDKVDYIYGKYDWTVDWEYHSNDNIDILDYTINLTLK